MTNFCWPTVIDQAISQFDTPCYICAWEPVKLALRELSILESSLPCRHWLSFKTQPVRPMLCAWRDKGQNVEVVSEYEFQAAIREGFQSSQVLVNGVAKHTWLNNYDIPHIRVHFDSLEEVQVLSKHALQANWHTGIRIHLSQEIDPDEPGFGGQFGMNTSEAQSALQVLRGTGNNPDSIHFHLRSNIHSAQTYQNALHELSEICSDLDFYPSYVDCGGGLPVPGEWNSENPELTQTELGHLLRDMRNILGEIGYLFPTAKEIWMENGRFLTARSAVLVVRVIDVKERPECRYLICNGGRTNHALISDWEHHHIFSFPPRGGASRLTTICGPTCMAFDRLIRMPLPSDVQIGDFLVWMNAGAYHIPWETRFSNGLAQVIWCDENMKLSLARKSEVFEEWWGKWVD